MKGSSNHVQKWILLGPACLLLTLAAFTGSVVPAIAILGFLSCWRLKLFGLALSTIALSAFTAYSYFELPPEVRFWQVGMALAFLLSFLVIALCSEEVDGRVKALKMLSESRLEHLLRLDKTIKVMKKSQKHSQEEWQRKLSKAQHELAEKQGKMVAQEEVIAILREKVKSVHEEYSQTVSASVVEEMDELIDTLMREKELLQSTLSRLQNELSISCPGSQDLNATVSHE